MTTRTLFLAAACAALVLHAGAARTIAQTGAAAPAVKRTIVLQQDMSIAGREAVMALVELPPGSAEGRHLHNADVYAFVQEGTIVLEHDGQPMATLTAGQAFHIPAGAVHQAINTSGSLARLAATFIAVKGQPLTVPAK